MIFLGRYQLDSGGIEKYILIFDGEQFTLDGEPISFNRIHDMCNSENELVSVKYNNTFYYTTQITENLVVFSTPDENKLISIKINSDDEITINTTTNENVENKITDISQYDESTGEDTYFSSKVVVDNFATKDDLSDVEDKADEAIEIAKGAGQAEHFNDYQTMVAALNGYSSDKYNIGQNILIVTLDVPDLWISNKYETSEEYTYTTDQAIVDALKTTGYVRIGYFNVSALETGKVDLSGYVKTEDLNNYYNKTETNSLLNAKQNTLISGTNIKTINNQNILGEGNIDIQGGGALPKITIYEEGD